MSALPSPDRRCPLCGGDHFVPFRFGLLRCEACQLVLSPAIWQQAPPDARPDDEWFGENYAQRKSSVWVEWFEARNNRRTLSRLARLPLSGGRLLDIGVGSGSFLRAAREAGFEVKGCDTSAPICRQAAQTHGVAMHCGPVETLPGEACFEVVVMNHVLEHVTNPSAFLREVHRLLTPGGIVHMAVPNIACWEAHWSGWTSYEPYHLAYFDRAALQQAIRAANLETVSLATHESFSGWFLALLRTASGIRRGEGALVRRSSPGADVDLPKRRPAAVEHAYRAAMTIAGGGAMAASPLAGVSGTGRRAGLYRTQAVGQG